MSSQKWANRTAPTAPRPDTIRYWVLIQSVYSIAEVSVQLSITTTHQPATDLGYLLHKNPARVQSFTASFGRVHVYYPDASAERCTAVLLLDVDPVGLVRKGRGQEGSGFVLEQYVNDRPYAASSFLSVAIVFDLPESVCQERNRT